MITSINDSVVLVTRVGLETVNWDKLKLWQKFVKAMAPLQSGLGKSQFPSPSI